MGGGQNRKRIKECANALSDEMSKRIFKQVIAFRVSHNYRQRPDYNKKNQYFPNDIVTLKADEVFIDCGAYTGDTVQQFLRQTQNQYKRIVAFEPDNRNLKKLRKVTEDIVIIKAAVWSHDTKVSFEGGKGSGSTVKKGSSNHLVKARAIDGVNECKDATFIKMDIEGSEYNALQGAYHTIRKNKPVLAICIYHSDEDMLRIIELISNWKLGYKLYIRHHGQRISETVLYAIQ